MPTYQWKQYSGTWPLQTQMQAAAQGEWPVLPDRGYLYTWGSGGNGRTGHNDTVARSSPTQVGSDSIWVTSDTASGNTAIVKLDGTLWVCGANASGQLGQNDRVLRSSPTQVGALTNWSKMAIASSSMLGLKTDGTLWSWGLNSSGQLGQNDLTNRSSPTQIGSEANWASIFKEQDNAFFAVKTTGTLWSWGDNTFGQLGLNDIVFRSSPTQVGALTNWSSASGGPDNWRIVLKTDGTLWSWGFNTYGYLGHNDIVTRSSPVQVGALTNWRQVSAASESSIAIKENGSMWSWGRGAYGQLGQGDETDRSSPVQVGALTTWSQVSGGKETVLALKTDGTLWSWGRNEAGQLGQNIGVAVTVSSPTQIGSSTNWVGGFSIYASAAAILKP